MDSTSARRQMLFERQYWYAENVLSEYFGLSDYNNRNVLEIGGGESGVLKYFDEQGANTYGVELSDARFAFAKAQLANTNTTLIQGDICQRDVIRQFPSMDFVILRDVIEHIIDKRSALMNIKDLLSDTGELFLSFPPKYSPYAGHQQIIKGKFRQIPFMHLLPRKMYRIVLNVVADSPERVEKLLDRYDTMISISTIERLFRDCGLHIKRKDYYLIRPYYGIRFGLTPRKTFLNKLPVVKEMFSLGALYILNR